MLVETLQDPFLNQGKYLKKEIACTLVSGTNHVKAALQALDQHVDTAYGQGIIQFNNACKEFEATMATGQTRFRKVYEASKVISPRYYTSFTHAAVNLGKDQYFV